MKKRILCYGDSDTWGQIAGTGERRDERWPVVCARLLGGGEHAEGSKIVEQTLKRF